MRYLYLAIFLAGAFGLQAQPGADQRFDWEFTSNTLEQAFYDLSELTGIPISFSNSALPQTPLPAQSFHNKSLEEIIEALLEGRGTKRRLQPHASSPVRMVTPEPQFS